MASNVALIVVDDVGVRGPKGESGLADVTYPTRDGLIAAIGSGGFLAGAVYTIGGYQYIYTPGATAIPDMPGFLPFGDIHVEHFGAKGDLVYGIETVTLNNGFDRGYVRRGGTNDRVAFQAANDYAATISGTVHALGNYFVSGQVNLTASLKGNFGGMIWSYYTVMEAGFRDYHTSNISVTGLRFIAQYDVTTSVASKPGGSGQLGSVLCIEDCFTPHDFVRPVVTGVEIDILVCRAADTTSGLSGVNQNSFSAILVTVIGHVEFCKVRIGVHGKTNVPSISVFLTHWGALYDETFFGIDDPYHNPGPYPSGATSLNVQDAPCITSFHPLFGELTFSTRFNGDDGHQFKYLYSLASTGGWKVGPMDIENMVGAYEMGVGDLTDYYATPRQKGLVGACHEIGFVTATRMKPGYYTSADPSAYVCFFKCYGTSRFEPYDGSSEFIRRAIPWNFKCAGHRIEIDGYTKADGTVVPLAYDGTTVNIGIFLWGQHPGSHIDLGDVQGKGITRSLVENESGHGIVKLHVNGGTGTIRHEMSTGLTLTSSLTDFGNAPGAAVSGENGVPGYDSDNRAVTVEGVTSTATTAAAGIAAGAVRIDLATPFSRTIFNGDRLLVDGNEVYATGQFPSGVLYLTCTPLQKAVVGSKTITLDQSSSADYVAASFASTEYGVRLLNGGSIKVLDLSGLKWSGRTAVFMTGICRIGQVIGRLPASVGRSEVSGSKYTFDCSPQSHVNAVGLYVPDNPNIAAHFNLQSNSTNQATLVMHGGVVENQSKLYVAAQPARQVNLLGTVSPAGQPLVSPASTARTRNIYVDGDSRSDACGANRRTYNQGFAFWLQTLTRGRVLFSPNTGDGGIQAIAGDNSEQMLAHVGGLGNVAPGTVIVFVSTNDRAQGWAASRSITALTAYQNAALGYGHRLVWIAETPKGDSVNTADTLSGTQLLAHQQVRQWFLDQAVIPNVYAVDPWKYIVETMRSDARAKDGILTDGVHIAAYGCYLVAKTLQPVIEALIPPVDILPVTNADIYSATSTGNLIPNFMVDGTAGTLGSGASGSVATSWTATCGAGIAAVCSKVTGSDGKVWQQAVVSGTPTGVSILDALGRLDPSPVACVFSVPFDPDLTVGDTMQGMCEIEMDAGSTGIRGVALFLEYTDGGGRTLTNAGEGINTRTKINLDMNALPAWSGIITTPVTAAVGTVSGGRAMFMVHGADFATTGIAMNATVRFRAVKVRKIIDV